MSPRVALWVCLVIAACSAAPDGVADGSAFWNHYRFSGLEAEHYSGLDEMTDGADAIVAGRIERVEPGRMFQGDVAEDRVYYASLTLKADRVLSGDARLSSLSIELLLPQVFTDDEFTEAIGELREILPSGRVLVFLREKNDPDPNIYRPVNTVGLFASTVRSEIDTPLNDDSPEVSGVFDEDLARVRTIDELVDLVAASS